MSRSSFAGAGAAAALACLRMKPARLSGTEGAALAGPLETCVLDSMVGLVTASTRRGDGGLPACGARMVGECCYMDSSRISSAGPGAGVGSCSTSNTLLTSTLVLATGVSG